MFFLIGFTTILAIVLYLPVSMECVIITQNFDLSIVAKRCQRNRETILVAVFENMLVSHMVRCCLICSNGWEICVLIVQIVCICIIMSCISSLMMGLPGL